MSKYFDFWKKMTVFNATATRSQYWIPTIANYFLLAIYYELTNQAQYVVNGTYNMHLTINSITFVIITALLWLANFTVRARRLHDINKSNWWMLIELVPLIGFIWLFILMITASRPSRWTINQADIN
ncbi:DUF805 domain-containing protein [Companilactobacillus baiquanensis]|uniref:DUF805 domain-containing protein n=1 Tax=Companilactobacillus baiquanensis TaxID=2486005 RepID=A0ABW1UWE5_9LACO|nr:DUF805 domain-containing protein [Companilactobacillus baiquanensis]